MDVNEGKDLGVIEVSGLVDERFNNNTQSNVKAAYEAQNSSKELNEETTVITLVSY